jgi:hypothetical protein
MGNKLKGGLADGKSIEDIAKMHDAPVVELKSELANGIEVELEHTGDRELAEEIAMDHLYEDPEYYTKLKHVEESTVKKIFKRIIKEEVELAVTDETSDNTDYHIMYNGRVAGIIGAGTGPRSLGDDAIEITKFRLENGYENLYTANQAVRSLWSAYPKANRVVVNIPKHSTHFWEKIGFRRLNDTYHILMKGH